MYFGNDALNNTYILNEAVTKVNISGIGNVEILIKGMEGMNAHCHVYKNGKFHSCPKLYSAEYFSHNGKEDKFNKKQREEFNDIMKSAISEYSTVWQACCELYDQRNNYHLYKDYLSSGGTMPDYTKLK